MNEVDTASMEEEIVKRLRSVIVPETSVDVVHMRLVEDLSVDSESRVAYTFIPSPPLCPNAVYLVKQIKHAEAGVPGVSSQHITIEGHFAADEMTELIKKENKL